MKQDKKFRRPRGRPKEKPASFDWWWYVQQYPGLTLAEKTVWYSCIVATWKYGSGDAALIRSMTDTHPNTFSKAIRKLNNLKLIQAHDQGNGRTFIIKTKVCLTRLWKAKIQAETDIEDADHPHTQCDGSEDGPPHSVCSYPHTQCDATPTHSVMDPHTQCEHKEIKESKENKINNVVVVLSDKSKSEKDISRLSRPDQLAHIESRLDQYQQNHPSINITDEFQQLKHWLFETPNGQKCQNVLQVWNTRFLTKQPKADETPPDISRTPSLAPEQKQQQFVMDLKEHTEHLRQKSGYSEDELDQINSPDFNVAQAMKLISQKLKLKST